MCKNIQIKNTRGSQFIGGIYINSKFRTFNGYAKRLHRYAAQIYLRAVFSLSMQQPLYTNELFC